MKIIARLSQILLTIVMVFAGVPAMYFSPIAIESQSPDFANYLAFGALAGYLPLCIAARLVSGYKYRAGNYRSSIVWSALPASVPFVFAGWITAENLFG